MTSLVIVAIWRHSCLAELGEPQSIKCCYSLKIIRLSLYTSAIPLGQSRILERK